MRQSLQDEDRKEESENNLGNVDHGSVLYDSEGKAEYTV